MSLSQRTKDIMTVALADKRASQELAAAVDAAGNSQAASVAALAAYSPVTGVDGTGSDAASKADVDTELGAVYTKINAILSALKAAGLMASP